MFGLDEGDTGDVAEAFWAELEAKSADLPVLPWRTFGRSELARHFRYLSPQLRALSIVATTDGVARPWCDRAALLHGERRSGASDRGDGGLDGWAART